MKAIADDELDFAKIMIPVYDRVENIVGKGKMLATSIFWLPAFSPYLTVFSKGLFVTVV